MATLTDADIKRPSQREYATALEDTDVFVVEDVSEQKIKPITKTNAKATLGITSAEGTIADHETRIDTAEDAITTLKADETTEGSVAKSVKDNAKDATYDNSTSGLTADTLGGAIDEVEGRVDIAEGEIDDLQTAETEMKGTGWTDENLVDHEDRLDTLEGTGEGSVAKAIDDAVSPLAEVVDTNRLYSDSQYLALKAKADSLQVKCNTLQAEVYTDDPILQYGATEIIGKGYEADDTPIDVSANVVDGSLALEQKGLTITNLVDNNISAWSSLNSGAEITDTDGVIKITRPNTSVVVSNSPNKLISGNKYYLKLWANPIISNNYASINKGTFYVNFSTDFTSVGYYDYLFTADANTDNISFTFSSATTVEVDIDDVQLIDLTALGLDHITDTAILAKLLPYVDGTKNVGKMGMRVVGRNYFTSKTQADWAVIANRSVTILSPNSFIVKNTTNESYPIARLNLGYMNAGTYTIKFDAYIISGTAGVRISLDSVFIGFSSFISLNGSISYTFILTQNGNVSFDFHSWHYDVKGNTLGKGEVQYNNVQLNLGSSALPYEPYQEQLTFLPAIGNSLPNGTADSIKTVADGWEHSKRVSTPASVGSGVAVNTTNYPTAKNGGQWVNELTAGGTEIGVVGTDSTTGAGMLRFELATPIVTKYDLPLPTSGKTIHRFAGEEKIVMYGTGVTFSENVLTVLSAVKFVAGQMTDITALATITGDTVTFSGVDATDVVFAQVEHDVNKPLGVLEHTPAVSNTASRLASLEARVSALEV